MKRLLTHLTSWALLGLVLGCARREEPQPSSYYELNASYRPLLLTRAALENAVAVAPAQALHNTGKLYLYGHYIFLNEKYEGIHIIDNQDPANPRPVSFLRIPGNVDMAVRNGLLYADNGPDLVTLDVRDPAHAQLRGRVREAFRELPMPEAGILEEAYQPAHRPADAVVVGWRKLKPGEGVPIRLAYTYAPYYGGGNVLFATTSSTTTASAAAVPAGSVGKGGSLARFAIVGQALYTVDENSLHLFDLQNPTEPTAGPSVALVPGVETIFPQDHYLFLGTQRGLYIFDVATPAAPQQLSFYQHLVSCDPVVVDGRYAYVTLRNGRPCGGGTNVLEVIDLTNLSQPKLATTLSMTSPQGLGAENNRLFVCDNGLKLYDTSRAPALTLLQTFPTPLTDVVPNGDYLLAVGTGGLYQYRVGSTSLQQVSALPITPTP